MVFIDIYDFGRVVAGLHPVDLVLMLDRIFTHMDLICQDSLAPEGRVRAMLEAICGLKW